MYRHFVTNPNPPPDSEIIKLVQEEFELIWPDKPTYPHWYRSEQEKGKNGHKPKKVYRTPEPKKAEEKDGETKPKQTDTKPKQTAAKAGKAGAKA